MAAPSWAAGMRETPVAIHRKITVNKDPYAQSAEQKFRLRQGPQDEQLVGDQVVVGEVGECRGSLTVFSVPAASPSRV